MLFYLFGYSERRKERGRESEGCETFALYKREFKKSGLKRRMNRVSQMIRQSSAWDTFVTRPEDSVVAERKISESGLNVHGQNHTTILIDLDFEAPTEATRRKECLLNKLKKEVNLVQFQVSNFHCLHSHCNFKSFRFR